VKNSLTGERKHLLTLDPEIVKNLDLKIDDAIEITNRVNKVSFVWVVNKPIKGDRGKGIIRIVKYLRKTLKVEVNDFVEIRKIETKPADEIILAGLKYICQFTPLSIQQLLSHRITREGDYLTINFGLRRKLTFKVIKCAPKADSVRITNETKVIVLNQTFKDLKKNRVD